ncbi:MULTISPECIES: helix-turn-helix transcriptional regulator [unclassified Curtobacterium]|uniref:helix-turn-helix transcriptional regulator n=1 Tax=unclassified Curtobacterium TaxID=257496 RepID=UPI0038289DD8
MDEGVGPVVVAANWYRFRAGERIRHERVLSECWLWVLGGTGRVRSHGVWSTLAAGSVLRLPWDHDVEYRADARSPFRLGTVHVVPRHARGVPVVPAVAHQPGDPLYASTARDGDSGRPEVSGASSARARRVASLGRYTVERFVEGPWDESTFRALGELFRAESARAESTNPAPRGDGGPAALERMTAFVVAHLDVPFRVADVAAAGGCSVSTAGRLFTAHLGTSVSGWVRGARMREAAELLRTSGLRVGEVARAVGFSDQLYFSRVFRATFGEAPSRYGRGQIRP